MTTDAWLLLMLTLFAGAASPGPSLALVMRTALSNGRLAGLLVATAHGFGVWVYALIVALGIASILQQVEWAMAGLKLLGVLFIAFLGTSMISDGLKTFHNGQGDAEEAFNATIKTDHLTHLRDGFLIVFFNPKIIFFFLAVFSQFLSAEQSIFTQINAAILAGILDAGWYALVAVIVSTGQIANRLKAYAGHIDVGFGFILCGIALTIIIQSL